MAESYLKFRGCTLELEASQFALVFAVIDQCIAKQPTKWSAFHSLTELKRIIHEKSLNHNWHHVFDLDPYLRQELDVATFLELIADSIARIRNAG